MWGKVSPPLLVSRVHDSCKSGQPAAGHPALFGQPERSVKGKGNFFLAAPMILPTGNSQPQPATTLPEARPDAATEMAKALELIPPRPIRAIPQPATTPVLPVPLPVYMRIRTVNTDPYEQEMMDDIAAQEAEDKDTPSPEREAAPVPKKRPNKLPVKPVIKPEDHPWVKCRSNMGQMWVKCL